MFFSLFFKNETFSFFSSNFHFSLISKIKIFPLFFSLNFSFFSRFPLKFSKFFSLSTISSYSSQISSAHDLIPPTTIFLIPFSSMGLRSNPTATLSLLLFSSSFFFPLFASVQVFILHFSSLLFFYGVLNGV